MAEEPSTVATLPNDLAFGESFVTPDGIQLSVTRVSVDERTNDPRHLVLDVHVVNTADGARDFENNFGVLDAMGTPHRYGWVNSEDYPDVLPGFTSLEPGGSLFGRVHVQLPELPPDAVVALRPAYLGFNVGCGACSQELMFFPPGTLASACGQVTACPTG